MMQFVLAGVLSAVMAYLLGSISFSILFTKFFSHKDIRSMGSGNAGTTNVLRSVGAKAAACTFVFDFAKGVVAVLIGKLIFQAFYSAAGLDGAMSEFEFVQYGAFIAAAFCVLGHDFPVFFGFKGGKGVLTSWSITLLIDWRLFVITIVVFIVLLLITRVVSIGSIAAAISLPVSVFPLTFFVDYLQYGVGSVTYCIVVSLISLFLGGLLIWKHRSNIERIREGTEKKLSIHKEK